MTTLNQAVGSEDCLYLNIWRPATGKKDLLAIVFFHGGSNASGYTAGPVYDSGNLAKTTNSVVVTVNFRLGILGFINLPQRQTRRAWFIGVGADSGGPHGLRPSGRQPECLLAGLVFDATPTAKPINVQHIPPALP